MIPISINKQPTNSLPDRIPPTISQPPMTLKTVSELKSSDASVGPHAALPDKLEGISKAAAQKAAVQDWPKGCLNMIQGNDFASKLT